MFSSSERRAPSRIDISLWQKRFQIALTVLAWILIAGIGLWLIGLIIGPIILLIISALLAYIFYPLVKLFQHIMPRPIAILLTLLIVFGALLLVMYFVLFAAIKQLAILIHYIQSTLQNPSQMSFLQPLIQALEKAGISQNQIRLSEQQVISYLQGALTGLLPLVTSIFALIINSLVVASLSVYFLVDGGRTARWLRNKTPLKIRDSTRFMVDVIEHSMGGFVRGQMLLGFVISAITGVGALFIGVPYIILLCIIVFIFEFVPIVGAYISGAIGILFALTQGWQTALIYAIFVTLVNGMLEGQILAPRIVGHSVGLHPIISIFALLAGSKLFGFLGALLACPIAGIVQTIIISYWSKWHNQHPEQFPEEIENKPEAGRRNITPQSAVDT